MPPAESAALSVSPLNARIRASLESSFKGVWVEGELSNVKINAASGHAYFTLKDARAQVSAVMFAGNLRNVAFRLADGVKVKAYGDVSVYEPRGQYQLVVRALEKVGAGDLLAQLEELKRKLAAEGLFSRDLKLPLPVLPRAVGIVTSPTGAAIRDIFNVTRRRCPGIRLILSPCRVQGEGAAADIVAAVRLFESLPAADRPDVLIVGRGGGSIEDLWCFNDETLVRELSAFRARTRIPVISAVGHEIDFTLSDYVADQRAPTPSAAAEVVAGRTEEFLAGLRAQSAVMTREVRFALESARSRLARARDHHVFRQPGAVLATHRQHLDLLDSALGAALSASLAAARTRLAGLAPRLPAALASAASAPRARLAALSPRLENAVTNAVEEPRRQLAALERALAALSPYNVLQRGYALVRDASGAVVKSPGDVAPGDPITARLPGGGLSAVVTDGGGTPGPARKKTCRTRRTDSASPPPPLARPVQGSLF